MSFFPITTERLRLRRMQPGDVERFAAYRADPELARYQGWSPMSVEEAERFVGEMQAHPDFVEESWLQVAIALRQGDELVGDVGLCLHARGELELGFTLERGSHGKGLAIEAIGALIEAALWRPDVRRIVAFVDERNEASIRVLGRLGMTFISREEALFKGEMCVELRYQLEGR